MPRKWLTVPLWTPTATRLPQSTVPDFIVSHCGGIGEGVVSVDRRVVPCVSGKWSPLLLHLDLNLSFWKMKSVLH